MSIKATLYYTSVQKSEVSDGIENISIELLLPKNPNQSWKLFATNVHVVAIKVGQNQ